MTSLEVQFTLASKCRVLESFCDGHIGVLEVCVLADKSNINLIEEAFLPESSIMSRLLLWDSDKPLTEK